MSRKLSKELKSRIEGNFTELSTLLNSAYDNRCTYTKERSKAWHNSIAGDGYKDTRNHINDIEVIYIGECKIDAFFNSIISTNFHGH